MKKEDLIKLIEQTEGRISLVDTKASIILAFYGILLTSHKFFIGLHEKYFTELWISYTIVVLLFISGIFLVLTLKPYLRWYKYFLWTKTSNELTFTQAIKEKFMNFWAAIKKLRKGKFKAFRKKLFPKAKAKKRTIWLTSNKQVEAFNYTKITSIEKEYQTMFKELSKRRIVKYYLFRRAMWCLRISILLFAYLLFAKIIFSNI